MSFRALLRHVNPSDVFTIRDDGAAVDDGAAAMRIVPELPSGEAMALAQMVKRLAMTTLNAFCRGTTAAPNGT